MKRTPAHGATGPFRSDSEIGFVLRGAGRKRGPEVLRQLAARKDESRGAEPKPAPAPKARKRAR